MPHGSAVGVLILGGDYWFTRQGVVKPGWPDGKKSTLNPLRLLMPSW